MRSFNNILSLIVTVGFVAFALPVAAQEAAPATLTIHVRSVAPEGVVRLGLYTEAQYPDDDSTPVMSADVPAVGGETIITLKNVPVGVYAIEVFQDLNSNGKMDTNFLGLPREPYGFSRDAHPRLSKPDFSRVKFEVAAGQNDQSLHLQNTMSLVASN